MSEGNIEDTNIKVVVRVRPFSNKEKGNSENNCVQITRDQINLLNPHNPQELHEFGFDVIFDQNSEQVQVWELLGVPILSKAFSGFNATIFAYGQTGSGKTWTMQGGEGIQQGIIPRMNNSLFEKIANAKETRSTLEFLVTVSYFEIYNEVLFDLLDGKDRKKKPQNEKGGLEIKEHPVLGVYVKGLQEIVVDNANKMQSLIDQGMRNRTTASTQMNADSSRSHSVFTITIHQKDTVDESKNIFAKVNLVDLAGSERQKSTGASGATLKEGANINKSLSALGNVINALVETSKGKSSFVPYRNSKLTRVLQESLGGNSITAMLAALSPAGSNFDETLSTLKYANRAKDIKVKAIKNEEASQIVKLNDEIKLLREKLLNQPTAQITQFDTSEIEEKHKQQLRELEEAMKTTWEAKAKMSEDHDLERRRLEAEQRAAERELEATRERNWKMLEDKGDIELSITHLKGMVKKVPEVTEQTSLWLIAFKNLIKLEQKLNEQDTVVQVYRTALEKDCNAILKSSKSKSKKDLTSTAARVNITSSFPGKSSGGGGNINSSTTELVFSPPVACDKATLSLWRQLKDKFSNTRTEVTKWIKLQDDTQSALSTFLQSIGTAIQTFKENNTASYPDSNNESSSVTTDNIGPGTGGLSHSRSQSQGNDDSSLKFEEISDIKRGMQLILDLLKIKDQACQSAVKETRSKIIDFNKLNNDFSGSVSAYLAASQELWALLKDDRLGIINDPSKDNLINTLNERQTKLAREATRCIEKLTAAFNSSGKPTSSSSQHKHQKAASIPVVPKKEDEIVRQRKVEHCSNSSCSGSGNDVSVDSQFHWSCPNAAFASSSFLELILPERRLVKEVCLQGGMVLSYFDPDSKSESKDNSRDAKEYDSKQSKDSKSSSTQNIPTAEDKQGSSIPPRLDILASTIALPCGLTMNTCSQDIEMSCRAVSCIIDWQDIIKKSAPEKFLKRPPIRFLFDLFKHIAQISGGLFPANITDSTWEIVGESKQAKLDFMNNIIKFVSEFLKIPPVTTGTNIISGAEPELSNTFIQQMTVLVYAKLNTVTGGAAMLASGSKDSIGGSSSKQISIDVTKSMSKALPLPKETACLSWPTSVRVMLSTDGRAWTSEEVLNTSLKNESQSQWFKLSKGPCNAKFIKFVPLKWAHSRDPGDVGTSSVGPALRVLIKAEKQEDETQSLHPASSSSTSAGAGGSSNGYDRSQSEESGETVMDALRAMQDVTAFMVSSIEYIDKLDEAYQESKQEQLRKQFEGLANENQDAMLQLSEVQRLYESENAQKCQLEKAILSANEENQTLQRLLQEKIDEGALVNAQLLKFQASGERDRILIDNLNNKIGTQEVSINELVCVSEEYSQRKVVWENDKDDLLSQIAILTEERDAARVKEEELYEQLTEQTFDLDKLQESYVYMADQCNEAKDEVAELREVIEDLKVTFAENVIHSGSGSRGGSRDRVGDAKVSVPMQVLDKILLASPLGKSQSVLSPRASAAVKSMGPSASIASPSRDEGVKESEIQIQVGLFSASPNNADKNGLDSSSSTLGPKSKPIEEIKAAPVPASIPVSATLLSAVSTSGKELEAGDNANAYDDEFEEFNEYEDDF